MTDGLHVVCPHCDATNRIPAGKPAERGRCGSCGRKLFEGRPLALDGARFQRHLAASHLPLLVDFWAPWCGPCRSFAPVFERAAAEMEPALRLIKVDTEQETDLAGRLGIRSIPTLVLFAGGHERARVAGAMDLARLRTWVHGALTGA